MRTMDLNRIAVFTRVVDEGSSWARLFGHPLRWTSDSFLDNAGSRGLLKAAAAVTAGYADTVVVGGCKLVSRGPDNAPVGAGTPLEFTDVVRELATSCGSTAMV